MYGRDVSTICGRPVGLAVSRLHNTQTICADLLTFTFDHLTSKAYNCVLYGMMLTYCSSLKFVQLAVRGIVYSGRLSVRPAVNTYLVRDAIVLQCS